MTPSLLQVFSTRDCVRSLVVGSFYSLLFTHWGPVIQLPNNHTHGDLSLLMNAQP